MRRLISALLLWAVVALPTHAADKVKVGFLSTLSGPGGALGVDMRDAFLLAAKLNGGKLGRVPPQGSVGGDPQKPESPPQAVPRVSKSDTIDLITRQCFSQLLLPGMT